MQSALFWSFIWEYNLPVSLLPVHFFHFSNPEQLRFFQSSWQPCVHEWVNMDMHEWTRSQVNNRHGHTWMNMDIHEKKVITCEHSRWYNNNNNFTTCNLFPMMEVYILTELRTTSARPIIMIRAWVAFNMEHNHLQLQQLAYINVPLISHNNDIKK